MNFQKIIQNISKIDKRVLKITKRGLKLSTIFCLIAIYILCTYTTIGEPTAYYIGLSLLKSGLFFIVGVIICCFAFNKILSD